MYQTITMQRLYTDILFEFIILEYAFSLFLVGDYTRYVLLVHVAVHHKTVRPSTL